MENGIGVELCPEIIVDWAKVALKLQHLRMYNLNLRRYCCYVLKYLKQNTGRCEGKCMTCRYEMDKLISQDELAEVLNVGGAYVVSNWENGRSKPNIEDLIRICDICQITIEQLLGIKGQDLPN